MMSPRDILIGLTLLITLLQPVTPFDCPEFCTCTVAQDGVGLQNNASCKSLEGLKAIEGKHVPIHSLDLSNLSLTRLTTHLDKFRDLISLDLSHNQLAEAGKLGRRIKILNLSNNKITSGKLGKIPIFVEHLNLADNEITYLPLELKKLQSLKSIELSGNLINCTCDTLDVRNWLQNNHVFTDNHIKCTYPFSVKGKSWLHAKKSDICSSNAESSVLHKEQDIISDDENELMMGDQPIESEGSGQGNEDELGKDFMPVDEKKDKKSDDAVDLNAEEGSGDIFPITDLDDTSNAGEHAAHDDTVDRIPAELGSGGNEMEDDEQGRLMDNEDEGSGSGMAIFIPKIDLGGDDTTPSSNNDLMDRDKDENAPISPPQEEATKSPDDIFGPGLGIMISEDTTNSPVVEETVVKTKTNEVGSKPAGDDEVDGPSDGVDQLDGPTSSVDKENMIMDSNPNTMEEASTSSNNTYILLAVVLVLLIALIVFVAIKRRNMNRRRRNDVENPHPTELVDMNKKNIGKPTNKNGAPEHVPLIGGTEKENMAKPFNAEKKPNYNPNEEKDTKTQQPLLDQANKPESNNNDTADSPTRNASEPKAVAHNIEPVHKSPNDGTKAMDNNPSSDDEVFLPAGTQPSNPSSPKASRYSPVYSPETGRVKIKLLETPKPKTPLLVTRSRSNAGDVITTPNGNSLRAIDQSQ